jgi:hypothetical protein
MSILYKYDGAVWNGNVIYKTVVEYVYAADKRHAIVLLERRLKHKYPEISFVHLSESNLSVVPKRTVKGEV